MGIKDLCLRFKYRCCALNLWYFYSQGLTPVCNFANVEPISHIPRSLYLLWVPDCYNTKIINKFLNMDILKWSLDYKLDDKNNTWLLQTESSYYFNVNIVSKKIKILVLVYKYLDYTMPKHHSWNFYFHRFFLTP